MMSMHKKTNGVLTFNFHPSVEIINLKCNYMNITYNLYIMEQVYVRIMYYKIMPGVGLMVRVAGLGSKGPEFKSCPVTELILGGVDSACYPFKVNKMSTSLL